MTKAIASLINGAAGNHKVRVWIDHWRVVHSTHAQKTKTLEFESNVWGEGILTFGILDWTFDNAFDENFLFKRNTAFFLVVT